jgi:hypothetical protein
MAMNYKPLIWYSLGGLTCALCVGIHQYFSPKQVQIPKISEVAPGYVIPAEIKEIAPKDLNLDGKVEETIMRYKEKALLFRETSNGGVEGVPFDVVEKRY